MTIRTLPLALALAALPPLALPTAARAQGTEFGYTAHAPLGRPARFTVRVENVSTESTLKLSDRTTAPAPAAPLLWVVHTEPEPIFTADRRERGEGLEALAEDGEPEPLARALRGRPGVAAAGTVLSPDGETAKAAITPGKAYTFSFTAEPGQKLTIATMFGQSNDLFYAPDGRGILLFDAGGRPTSGDVTAELRLWDAGTEVNQEPGLGADQAPRQKAPNTGAAENGRVRPVRDQYRYPKVHEVLRVTITPEGAPAS